MYKITLFNDNEPTVIQYPNMSDIKVLSSQIKKGINVASEFVFNIAINNPGYNKIKPYKTLIEVLNTKTNRLDFEGRISNPYEEMTQNGIIFNTFDCEGELAYLNDSSQRHGEYHNISVRDYLQIIIDNHNRDVAVSDIDKTFELGIVDVDSTTGEIYRYLGYESTWATINDKLIDRLGGELRIRKENGVRYLDYLKEVGEVKHTEIRLAKNLKTISKNVDPTEIISRLIPLGERIESEDDIATDASQARLTIESVNNGKDYIVDPIASSLFGPITKSIPWDDITQPSILKTRGEEYLRNNNRVKTNYQIRALDLSLIDLDIDSFEVNNWYPVVNPLMGIDEHLRVIGKITNIHDPENSVLEIGDKFMTASEYQHKSNKAQRKVVELEGTVTRQSKRVNQLSQAAKDAQEEIQILHDLIENIDMEQIDESLTLITQQLVSISDAINDIGLEVNDLELRTILLEDFQEAQDLLNHELELFKGNQTLINEDFETRLLELEGDN